MSCRRNKLRIASARARSGQSSPFRLLSLSVKLGILLVILGSLSGGLLLTTPIFFSPSGPPTAAIGDQLSIDVPNPHFMASAGEE